jgi:hypothetical protein
VPDTLEFLFESTVPRTGFARRSHRWHDNPPAPVHLAPLPRVCEPGRVTPELRLALQSPRDLPPGTHMVLDIPFRMKDHALSGRGRERGACYVALDGPCEGCAQRLTVFGRVSAMIELVLGERGLAAGSRLYVCIGGLHMPCRPGQWCIQGYGRLPGGQFGPFSRCVPLQLRHRSARTLGVYARPTANNVPFAVTVAAEQDRQASFMPCPRHEGTARLAMPGRIQVVSLGPDDRGTRRVQGPMPPADEPFSVTASSRRTGWQAESNLVHPGIVPEEYDLFFGDLHVHSGASDGYGERPQLMHLARDWQCLDFMAFNDHVEPGLSTRPWTPERWRQMRRQIDEFHEPGRFVPFGGLELNRHVNLWSRGDQYAEFELEEPGDWGNTLDTVRRLAASDEWLVGYHGFERLESVLGHLPPPVHLLQVAERGQEEDVGLFLARGDRTGFFAATDTHMGLPGRPAAGSQRDTPAGLTAVLAGELTRQGVFEALRARRCYATMGTRHLVWFSVNGHPMGEELALGPGATARIELRAAGREYIERVELWRNGALERSVFVGGQQAELEHEDTPPARGSTCWHARIVLEDGRLVWTSPVWITTEDPA